MVDDVSRILSGDIEDEADLVVEGSLRPRSLAEYIGQHEVKANLSVLRCLGTEISTLERVVKERVKLNLRFASC